MNTVDALKNLYKTLAGKDYTGDPNPTDAEMIDAIAKDASSGGGSSGGITFPEIVLTQQEYPDPPIVTGMSYEELYYLGFGESLLVTNDNGSGDSYSVVYTKENFSQGGGDIYLARTSVGGTFDNHYTLTAKWLILSQAEDGVSLAYVDEGSQVLITV